MRAYNPRNQEPIDWIMGWWLGTMDHRQHPQRSPFEGSEWMGLNGAGTGWAIVFCMQQHARPSELHFIVCVGI